MIFIKDKSLAITGATSILFFSSVGASNAIGLTSIPISSFSVTVAGNTSNAASSTGTLNTSSDSEALTGLNATDSFNSSPYADRKRPKKRVRMYTGNRFESNCFAETKLRLRKKIKP